MKSDPPAMPPLTSPSGERSLTLRIAITMLVIVLSGLFLYAVVVFLWRWEQLQLADALTRRFEELVAEVRGGERDLEATIGAFHSVDWEYRSGGVQTPGSSIDNLVERYRRSAKSEIRANLRERTSVDLGDDPQAWIAAYRAGELSERSESTSHRDTPAESVP